jgi:hypothetical protein
MFRPLVHVSLIASLLGCPMWCQAGRMARAHGDTVQSERDVQSERPLRPCGCCCERPEESAAGDSSGHGSTPNPSERPCCSMCQCICAGAVFEHPILPNEAGHSLDWLAADVFDTSTESVAGIDIRPSGSPLAISGRDICRLKCVLRC